MGRPSCKSRIWWDTTIPTVVLDFDTEDENFEILEDEEVGDEAWFTDCLDMPFIYTSVMNGFNVLSDILVFQFEIFNARIIEKSTEYSNILYSWEGIYYMFGAPSVETNIMLSLLGRDNVK
jgi:hypothetical protein